MHGLLYFFHQPYAFLFRIEFLGLFEPVQFVLFYVEDREFQQFLLVSPLRDGEGDAFHFHVDGKGGDDFLGTALVAFPHFSDAQRQQFFGRLVHPFFIFKGEGLVDTPVRHVQVVDVSRVSIVLNGENVDVVEDVAHHFALAPVAFQKVVLPFDGLCLFETHFRRQRLHFGEHVPADFGRVSFQDFLGFLDGLEVFFAALRSDARAFAVLDVVFQTDVELSATDVFRCEREVARAQRIEVLDELE